PEEGREGEEVVVERVLPEQRGPEPGRVSGLDGLAETIARDPVVAGKGHRLDADLGPFVDPESQDAALAVGGRRDDLDAGERVALLLIRGLELARGGLLLELVDDAAQRKREPRAERALRQRRAPIEFDAESLPRGDGDGEVHAVRRRVPSRRARADAR